eukprot:2709055-Lingulodinium_polyedra.AAC.1
MASCWGRAVAGSGRTAWSATARVALPSGRGAAARPAAGHPEPTEQRALAAAGGRLDRRQRGYRGAQRALRLRGGPPRDSRLAPGLEGSWSGPAAASSPACPATTSPCTTATCSCCSAAGRSPGLPGRRLDYRAVFSGPRLAARRAEAAGPRVPDLGGRV